MDDERDELLDAITTRVTGAKVMETRARHWVGGRSTAQILMWDFGALNRDGGIGSVFAGYSSKNRDGW